MFLIEVEFKDESLSKERLILRRPQAIIGAGEDAHITLDDLSFLDFQILLSRDVGRKFHLDAVPIRSPQLSHYSKECKKNNEAEAYLNFDSVGLKIIALDTDLVLKEDESPDKSGIRILRQVCSTESPSFPALRVEGGCPLPFCISFSEYVSVNVGRNNNNMLRIDYPEVSGSHARIGFENGKFWIEDLGSTNGTYLGQQQISGKTNFDQHSPVKIARSFYIYALTKEDSSDAQITNPNQSVANGFKVSETLGSNAVIEERYPALISVSSIVRPARVVVKTGSTIRIGRDQTSDIWVGAPHISRMHSTVVMNDKNQVMLSDFSTNGTIYDGGILKRGDSILINNEPKVFDFGSGVMLAICFNESEEIEFLNSKGSYSAFTGEEEPQNMKFSQVDEIDYQEEQDDEGRIEDQKLRGFFIVSFFKVQEFLKPAGRLGIALISLSICFVLVALISVLTG